MKSLISHQQLVNAKRILYMTHLALGDYVYQGVWLKALKQKYPHLIIDIWFDDCRKKPQSWTLGRNKILSEWLESQAIYEQIFPIVDSVAEREAQITKAYARDYDLVVFIGKNRSEQYAKIARRIAPKAFIVAAKSKPYNNVLRKWWHFNKLDGHFSFDQIYQRENHITDVYLRAFGEVFGLTEQDTGGQKQLSFELTVEDVAVAEKHLIDLVGPCEEKLKVFINHLSTSTKKDYPFEQLAQVMTTIASRYPASVFIVNTPPDKFEGVSRQLKADEHLSKLKIAVGTAKSSFFEIPAIMSLCDVVIGVDTATSHFAVSLNKPQVTVMPSSLPLWQPLGDTVVLEGNGRASSVTPEQVALAFDQQVIKDLNLHPALLSQTP